MPYVTWMYVYMGFFPYYSPCDYDVGDNSDNNEPRIQPIDVELTHKRVQRSARMNSMPVDDIYNLTHSHARRIESEMVRRGELVDLW